MPRFDDLTDASGLAVSLKNPACCGRTRSGDGAVTFTRTFTGEALVRRTGRREAVVWEDRRGPCGDDECLLSATFVDNGNNAPMLGLPRGRARGRSGTTLRHDGVGRWDISRVLRDGPRDAEALAVHPDGAVYLFASIPAAQRNERFPE
jgi:hypothetical protein